MKSLRHILVGLLLIISVGARAQAHGLQVGVRGGANLWQGSELKGSAGLSYGLDLSYTCRWFTTNDFSFGPKIGISIVHSAGGFKKDDIYEQFTNYDYLGHPMAYTVRAAAKQTFSQWQAEIPVMLSLNINHFILNLGGKFVYMFSGKTDQTIQSADIIAQYTEYKVDVRNELLTGLLSQDQRNLSTDSDLPKIHVLVGAEIGYEWEVAEQHFVGLALYANYALWSNNQERSAYSFITIDPISDPSYPVAPVRTHPLQSVYSSKMHYMDFGLKLYYQFEYSDYHFHGWHRRY